MSARVNFGLGMVFSLCLLLIGCRDKVISSGDRYSDTPGIGNSGLMPLTVGNWWDYRYTSLDTTDTLPDFRRIVRAMRTIHDHDYYLMVDSDCHTGVLDTLYFLRNEHNGGVMELNYPLDSIPEDTLFAWPHILAAGIYFFRQDCVQTLWDYPGHHGSESYFRFPHDSSNSAITYTFMSDSTGMVRQSYGISPFGWGFYLVNSHVVR